MPAISCTAADLAAASKCLCGIASPADRQRVMIYLLQHIAGLDSLTPAELVARAKCLCGIPENRLKAVEVALLCAATGGVPPCPPCPPGGNCTYQDMQVAWTPTTLKLGEVLGQGNSNTSPTINQSLTALSFLQSANENGFDISGFGSLVSLQFPNLTAISGGGFLNIADCPLLTTLSFPLLASVAVGIFISSNAGLTSIDLSSLAAAQISITANPSLAAISLPLWSPVNGQTNDFSGNALAAGTVNQILARCVASAGFVSGLVDTSGGTSDAPTGQGIADKATLNARLPGLAVTN